jgi:2C-methyl-D-erythritol 2,4-cyclodiphosphate synthase
VRVGIGYDVHPLVAGRPLVLGGVQISHPTGLDGYSDCTVIAQEPRLQPYLEKMQSNLAEQVGQAGVNVKGKSPEGLGVLGQGAGIAAQAVATIEEL